MFTVTGAETLLRVTLKPEDEQSELDKFFGYLQWTREGLREFRYPIVLWVTYRILKEISRRAPDFWSWRKAVLRFATESENLIPAAAPPPLQMEQVERPSDNFLPPLEELQAEIQQLESTSPNSPNLATLYDRLGQVYADRVRSGRAADLEQERQAAIDAFQTAIQQYQTLDRKSSQAAALNRLGNLLRSQSRYTDAANLHQQALRIAHELNNRRGEAIALSNLGSNYNLLGRYKRSIELHQQSLEIRRELSDQPGEAMALCELGSGYNSLGQHSLAIDLYQQSLKISRAANDRYGEAITLGRLGNAYHSLGQYQQAIDLHQQQLDIARGLSGRQLEAMALCNLGNVYDSLGQYQQAIDLYQQYLEIAHIIGDRNGEAISLFNQALTLSELDQHREGLEKLQQAKQLYAAIRLDHKVEQCDQAINNISQIIEEESRTQA